MNIIIFQTIVILSVILSINTTQEYINIIDFGAIGDGVTINTKSIQQAIDYANQNQIKEVFFPPGKYLTGQINLRSNLALKLDRNAEVLSSYDYKDFPTNDYIVIKAVNIKNIIITGGGQFNGQAIPHFVAGFNQPNNSYIPVRWTQDGCEGECRPRLIEFVNCSNILIENTTLNNSADWTLHFLGCNNVIVINSRSLGSMVWPNNDGIDIDSSQNVRVLNSRFIQGDDGVCLKSTKGYGPTKNIFVQNIVIESSSSAIKIGSATHEDFENIQFINISIHNTNRGLAIQLRDKGNVNNILFDNTPIWVSRLPRDAQTIVGTISNIVFKNILINSQNGIFISSQPYGGISNITMDQISARMLFHSNFTHRSKDYRPCFNNVVQNINFLPTLIEDFPPCIDYGLSNSVFIEGSSDILIENSFIQYDSQQIDIWGECKNSTNNNKRIQIQNSFCNNNPL